MNPVVFSASSVSAYLDCHLRWYFTYILNEQGVQSEAQAVGIAVHDYAEGVLRQMRGDGQAVVVSEAPIELTGVFNRDILPTYRNPVLIEAAFQIEVNGIPFSGIIDSVDRQDVGYNDDLLVDGVYIGPIQHDPYLCKPGKCPGPTGCWCSACERGLHPALRYVNILRDLKTTGSRPKAGRYHFNMVGYWLGARELGHEPAIMQLDYIIRTLKPYYWPEVVAAPDDNDIEWFAATLQAVADGVGRADYKPTGVGTRVCSYCPHRLICGPFQRYNAAQNPL